MLNMVRLLLFCCLSACFNARASVSIQSIDLNAPLPMGAFALKANQAADLSLTHGTLTLKPEKAQARRKVFSAPESFVYIQDTQPPVFGQNRLLIPEITIDFTVQPDPSKGSVKHKFVPAGRDLQLSEHPTWDYIVGVGDIIPKNDEHGHGYRVSLPFALVEKNQNCVHNGVILADLNETGETSDFYYQISSETCAYYKADMWGKGRATSSESAKMPSSEPITEATEPLSMSKVADKYRGINLSQLLLEDVIEQQDMTNIGWVIDGKHYVPQCQTRAGTYPFCDQLVLPSYSLAKSIFAGLITMRLQQRFGDVLDQSVVDWISQCNNDSNRQRWQDVTFSDLLNMTTGNYLSTEHSADESASHMASFFNTASHINRLEYACNQFPRKQAPGEQFVYHTSDTYLLGAGLQAYWKAKADNPQSDVFTDVLVSEIFSQAGLSAVVNKTRRTQDGFKQPFAGYGLFLLPSDVMKLMEFLNQQLSVPESSMFDRQSFENAMRISSSVGTQTAFKNIRYSNSFWAYNLKETIGCEEDSYVPYLMGYGGLSVVFLTPEIQFYYISDSHVYNWRGAAIELHKFTDLCDGFRPTQEQNNKGVYTWLNKLVRTWR